MNMDLDLTIDTSSPSKIMEQLQNQASLYAYYGEKYEDAKLLAARAKIASEQAKSEFAKKVRKEDPKISDAKLDKMVFDDPGYISSLETYNVRKHDEGKFKIIVNALAQRTEILLSINATKRQELRQYSVM